MTSDTKVKLGKVKYSLTGIAICNVCVKPCIIWYDTDKVQIKSKCCNAHISHTNVKVHFKKESLRN